MDLINAASALDAARLYLALGYVPIPVPKRTKRPVLNEWEKLHPDDADLPRLFRNGSNVGILLGDPSGGLVDVDLDAPEALVAADLLLPPTGMVHGRPGKPRSHRWYRVPTPAPRTERFTDRGAVLLEIRSTGGQTIVPPSVHTSGEVIEWASYDEPATLEGHHLRSLCAEVAAAALIARHWPHQGSRHDAALALSGVLLRAGKHPDDVKEFVRAVALAARDEEVQDRVTTVDDTAQNLLSGDPVTGLPRLAELVGQAAVSRVKQWLGVTDPAVEAARAAMNDRQGETLAPPPRAPQPGDPAAGQTPSPPPRHRFTLVSAQDVKSRPPPRWLVDSVLVEGSLAALSAPPAAFKTFVAVGIGLAVATATPWLGHDVQPGIIVYVSAEGSAGMGARIAAWEKFHAAEAFETAQFLLEAPQFLQTGQVDAVLEAIRTLPASPALVVIDTVARCFVGGDENDAKDMGLFVAGADRVRQQTGACVLLVHHVGKASGRLRGSGALEGALDTIIELKRDGDHLVLECAKQKDAEEFRPIHLRKELVDLGDGRSSVVLRVVAPTAAPPLPELHLALATLLWERFGEAGATAEEWTRAAEAAGLMTRRTAYRYRDDLVAGGHVVNTTPGRRGARYTASDTFVRSLSVQEARSVSSLTRHCQEDLTPGQRSLTSLTHPFRGVSESVKADSDRAPPVWACPDCSDRDWQPRSGETWICRGCGGIWSTSRAAGERVYLVDSEGSRLTAVPLLVTDITEHDGGKWCALDGEKGRVLQERLEPVPEVN